MLGVLKLNIHVSPGKKSRFLAGSLACVIVMAVGWVDYLTGYEMFFSVFYLLAIIPATWYGRRALGFSFSILSVAISMFGDFAAEASHLQLLSFVVLWNVIILFAFYSVLVVLVDQLHRSYEGLEQQVRERTRALSDEMGKREQLEKEILGISEREQRRIGQDLHDTLCQHLTGTALAAEVLQERLAAKAMPEEAQEAGVVTDLIQTGIGMSRDLACGLTPVNMKSDGLMAALLTFANGVTRRHSITCRFTDDGDVMVHDVEKAVNLFRIAQEAVTNAVKHSGASEIGIRLALEKGRVVLAVSDNGKGLPPDFKKSKGMGIRIMEHRASMIGATFSCGPGAAGGTRIACSIPYDESPGT